MRHSVPGPPSFPPPWAPRAPALPQPTPTRFRAPGAGLRPVDRVAARINGDVPCLKVWWIDAGDACTVTVSGEIDCQTATGFQEVLLEIIARPFAPGDVVVDLSRVRFLGAAGLTTLVLAHRIAEKEGRVLLIRCGTARAVIRSLQITGLWDALHVIERQGFEGNR